MLGLRNWSIRRRLLLAFGGVLIPYLALAGIGALAFQALWQRVEFIQHAAVREIKGVGDIQLAISQLVMPANDYLITGDARQRWLFEQRLAEVHEVLARQEVASFKDPEARRWLEAVRGQVRQMEAISKEILGAPDPRAAPALPAKMITLDQLADEAAASLSHLHEIQHREIEEEAGRGRAVIRRVTAVGLAALLLSLAGGVALALIFSTWLSRPILAIAHGSRLMAEGDLSQRVEATIGGELGVAAGAFNEMAERLNATVAHLKNREGQLHFLHETARSMSVGHELNPLLQRIVETAREVVGGRYGALAVFDRTGPKRRRTDLVKGPSRAVGGGEEPAKIRQFFTVGLTPEERSRIGLPPQGRGLLGYVFRGETLRLDDLTIHPAAVGFPLSHPPMQSFLGTPIRFRREVLGALYLTEKPGGFSADDEALLNTLCADAAVAIKNAHLYEEAQTHRARLTQVFESATDAIIVADSKGTIVSWNKAAQLIFGYDQEEVLGKPLTLLIPERSRDAHLEGFERARSAGELYIMGKTLEVDGLRKDGSEFQLELSLARWKTGGETYFSGILRDITERKRVEQMKSDFVSFTTHQLRTPLAGIKWLLELAAQEPKVPEETQSYIRDSRESAERLIRLVNDLLDASRLESGKLIIVPQETNLYELTLGVLEDLASLIQERGHRLLVTGADLVKPVWVDPQLLRQVILNLTSNAIKYTPPGGEIEIRLRAEGASVRWEIQDSGIGIPKEAQGRLFDKFYRVANGMTLEPEGTGLGLYLVRLIVERLGGRVWCESDEGKGATFIFTLPLPA